MSFFGSLWGRGFRNGPEKEPVMRMPTDMLPAGPEDLAEALNSPWSPPRVFLLHDLRCPVSQRAFHEAEGLGGEVHVIVVSGSPETGDRVEELVGIPHESPQALVIHDGSVVWHASHWDVTARRLRHVLDGLH